MSAFHVSIYINLDTEPILRYRATRCVLLTPDQQPTPLQLDQQSDLLQDLGTRRSRNVWASDVSYNFNERFN
jgi:hypothetical protein